jgi:hypothetical protein
MRGFICYDFGFGSGQRETEFIRLRHESGSVILRKCPSVAGGSVDDTRFAKIDRQARKVVSKAENRQEAYVAYF